MLKVVVTRRWCPVCKDDFPRKGVIVLIGNDEVFICDECIDALKKVITLDTIR